MQLYENGLIAASPKAQNDDGQDQQISGYGGIVQLEKELFQLAAMHELCGLFYFLPVQVENN